MADEVVSQLKQIGKRILLIMTTLPGLIVLFVLFNILFVLVFHYVEHSSEYTSEYYYELKFWESVFFFVTTFTTIGYDHLYPWTPGGKIVFMVYCMVGLPLALTIFTRTGKMVAHLLKIIGKQIQMAFCKKSNYAGYVVQNPDKTTYTTIEEENNDAITKSSTAVNEPTNNEFQLPVFVPILILIIYMLLAAMMYSLLEDWNYLDSIYFVFVSLSTIGYGDMLPSRDGFFIETSIFVIIGLILVSTCVNTVISKCKHSVKVTEK